VAKNKHSKFVDMETFSNVLQVTFSDVTHNDHPLKGNWSRDFFHNQNPVVLELGCGKGEYTVGLAEIDSSKNYIGVDIKGSRMWQGAKHALDNGLANVGFLRTHIEMIDQFFAAGEVAEIWLTFPDPQMKRVRKRLTSTRFIAQYRHFLKPGGIVHLKTDSNFQYQYTVEMAKANGFEIVQNSENIYESGEVDQVLSIKTFYEKQWIARGIPIKFISFIPHQHELIEPDVEIEEDSYRSFGRVAVAVD
jgi:tRNA (guanine-N7-)-methyltransferase